MIVLSKDTLSHRESNTPFSKDNIVEVNTMFLIAYLKNPFQRELGMYKAAIFSENDFTYSSEQF